MIVEGDARRDHVDQREALVMHGRLEQRHQLRLVAREAARDEGGAERDRQLHRIDRRLVVDLALLRRAADIGRSRELALGEPVDAVVLDHVDHVQVAADGVTELPEPDRQRVAVAGHADVGQVAVGGIGAGGDRRHAAMDGIEAVTAADEVGRGLR